MPTKDQTYPLFDPETGQQVTPDLGAPYLLLFLEGAARLIDDSNITRTDIRVFLAAISRSRLDGEPWDTDPQVLAQRLAMDDADVFRSIKKLVDRGYLRRPRRGKLAFDPLIAWRGSRTPVGPA